MNGCSQIIPASALAMEPSHARTQYRAVIFDLDGVLVDSEPIHFAALNAVLCREGILLTEEENSEFLGLPPEEVWTRLIRRFSLRGLVQDYLKRYEEEVARALQDPLKSPPFLPTLLQSLQEMRISLAIASSSRREWIESILNSLDLQRYFPVVVSSDDVRRGKPHPEVYLTVARKLGMKPSECLAVEDAPNGVLSAKRAGMDVAVLRTPYLNQTSFPPADFVLDSLADLLALINPAHGRPPACGVL